MIITIIVQHIAGGGERDGGPAKSVLDYMSGERGTLYVHHKFFAQVRYKMEIK